MSKVVFRVGMALGLPPWAFLMAPVSIQAQAFGLAVQFLGLILVGMNYKSITQ